MSDVDKFINIFEGSYSAYGQTRKTEEFDERGKHKTKSFIIKQKPTKPRSLLSGQIDNDLKVGDKKIIPTSIKILFVSINLYLDLSISPNERGKSKLK